jgi:ABC-type uncharacterized transport system ATPase subunit
MFDLHAVSIFATGTGLIVNRCVCIILVFVNKQAFWRWRFPNIGIEGVEIRKTDKRQKSYITLGQNATTLSGGEAQRIKLAKELSKLDTKKCISTLIKPSPLHASQRPPLTLKLNRPAL